MIQESEVKEFLNGFKIKCRIWGILYANNRDKNTETLLTLDISPSDRDQILLSLETHDYSQGPKINYSNSNQKIWVFGKRCKDEELYIKISLGNENNPTICISFHIAEYSMTYPFKTKKS